MPFTPRDNPTRAFADSPVLGKFTGAPAVDTRAALAFLIGRCEIIIGRGFLPEDQEAKLRVAINDACRAFNMAPLSEGLKRVLERAR